MMIQVAVIADDLTGANATGVQIRKNGLKVVTLMTSDRQSIKNIEGYDCLITATNSRAMDAKEAHARVLNMGHALLQHEGIKVFSKRIDSTLRGNLGSETDAFLKVLGEDYMAIVVPVFPSSGRVAMGGRLLVNNVPLHQTEAAADPTTPIQTPVIADIFSQQTQHEIGSIFIEELSKGIAHLSERLLSFKQAGKRIIVIDAVTENEVNLIAEAVITSNIKFLAVDPGVFTAAVCQQMVKPTREVLTSHNKILVAVGSVNPIAAKQVETFLATTKSHTVFMDVHEFLKGESHRQSEMNRVVEAVKVNQDHYEVSSVIGSGIHPKNRIDLKQYVNEHGGSVDEISHLINHSIAEIVQKLLASTSVFQGLYTSGGDISVAICEHLQAIGLELISEVVPLASYGILQKGPHEGLKLITKGGMVGDEDAIVTCVNHLKGEIGS